MGFEKIGDKDDRKEMTPGYSLYRNTETREIYYRFTGVKAREGSGGKKKVALVGQALGDRNCKSVTIKRKAMTIMEEAIKKGIVLIPGAEAMIAPTEPFRDLVKRQLAVNSELFRWRNEDDEKEITPKAFDKLRAAFEKNAYDYISPSITVTNLSKRDIFDLVTEMKAAKKNVTVKDDDGNEITRSVRKHSDAVIRSCLQGMKSVCDYSIWVTKVIDENPIRISKDEESDIHFKKPTTKHPETLERYEIVKLLEELKSRAEYPMRGVYWKRVELAVRLAVHSGMRSGEIRALKVDDIANKTDGNGNPTDAFVITVHSSWCDMTKQIKATKGGYTRHVFIWRDLAEELIDLSRQNPYDNGLIFWMDSDSTQPMYKDRFTEYLYSALDAIGIGKSERKRRRITFHSLRHFFVSATETTIEDAELKNLIKKEVGHKSEAVKKKYREDLFEGAYAGALISRDILKSTVPVSSPDSNKEDEEI